MVIKKRKGLSEIVGFFILLIILLAVLLPLLTFMFNQPTTQAQQYQNAQTYKNLAAEQFRDFEPVDFNGGGYSVAPVYFIYNGKGDAYFVFVNKQSPPVNLTIRYFEVYTGSSWETVNTVKGPISIIPSNANSKIDGYPAIEINLGQFLPYDNQAKYVAAVTQYGNIIYASPPYVLPMPSLKSPIGLAAIDPYNFTVLEDPGFQILSEDQCGIPIQNFIHGVNGQNSNAMTFVWAYLGSNVSSGDFTFDGYWFGAMAYQKPSLLSKVSGNPIFDGQLSGIFVGANFTFKGTYSGSIGSNSGYPIYFESGKASSITFNNSFIIGSIDGSSFSGTILLPGCILNNYFGISPNQVSITIRGETDGLTLINVSGSISFDGSFQGYVNGKQTNLNGKTTINGNNITGTINGNIYSASLSPSYTQQVFGGYVFYNGYIEGEVNNIMIQTTAAYNLFGSLIAAPIISGTFDNAQLSNTIVNSVLPSIFAFPLPFNATINDYEGTLTLSSNHGFGTFNGIITFPSLGFSLYKVGINDFSGEVNGEFEGGYWWDLGAWVSPVTLTVVDAKDAAVYPAYSGFTHSYYWVSTPLVVRMSLEIGNPSNETLEFTSIEATMKANTVYQLGLVGESGSSTYGATIYGSALDNLSTPIIVTPLNVSNYTITITIPVTSIFAPGLFPPSSNQNQQYQAIESFSVNYVELYLNFLEPNGYAIAVTTLIPPYSIPTQGQVS